MKRWEVIYTCRWMAECSDADGVPVPGTPRPYEIRRTQHRTWFGADFHRRFRYHHQGFAGSSYTETAIVRTVPPVAWEDRYERVPTDPRGAVWVEDHIWRWLDRVQNRWQGIRYGRA